MLLLFCDNSVIEFAHFFRIRILFGALRSLDNYKNLQDATASCHV